MKERANVSNVNYGKTILITGAGGLLGGELIRQLTCESDYKILALTSDKNKLMSRFPNVNQLECYSIDEFEDRKIHWGKVDILIHCAFARVSIGEELADSLNFAGKVFQIAHKERVSSIINISSKSVYGSKYKPLWVETTPVAPETLYAMAKYSSELLLRSIASKNNTTNFTNIRLDSLIGEGLDIRVVSKFVQKCINNEVIKIIGGTQTFSYLDIRDAASGIISLISTEPAKWKEVYNLGSNKRYNIIEIANLVNDVAKDLINRSVKIQIEKEDIILDTGMDSSLFYNDTNWTPSYSMEDTIRRLYKYFVKEKS